MNKIITISAKTSKKTTPITAPKELFGEKENPTLLTQALHVYRARSHVGQVLKQTRSEVSRTKSKWYKQKGTGKARHGARTPNIFVGGGLAHGPDGLKRVLTLPKAIRTKALSIALSQKLKDKKVYAVSSISSIKKTKEAQKLLDTISKENKRFTIVLSKKSLNSKKFFRNIPNLQIILFDNLNAHIIYFGGILVIDSEIFKKKVDKK